MEKTPSNTFTLSRRIGSTNYRVNAHFSEKAAETFEDKIFHLIQNEGLEPEPKCAIPYGSKGRKPQNGAVRLRGVGLSELLQDL